MISPGAGDTLQPMRSLAFAAVLCAVFVAGCGDGGGCGAPPEQKESTGMGAGAGGGLGGGGGGGSEIAIQDKRGKVPKPYQRPEATAQSKAPEPAAPKPADPAPAPTTVKATDVKPMAKRELPVATVVRRRVDGIAERVEIRCRVMASSPDGRCDGAANWEEIKSRCCPGGTVESCKTSMQGVSLVGLNCAIPK